MEEILSMEEIFMEGASRLIHSYFKLVVRVRSFFSLPDGGPKTYLQDVDNASPPLLIMLSYMIMLSKPSRKTTKDLEPYAREQTRVASGYFLHLQARSILGARLRLTDRCILVAHSTTVVIQWHQING